MRETEEKKERKYYNRKLIKDGIKSELKNPHKINLKEFVYNVIGLFLGFTLINAIGTENIIHNAAGRFVAEVLILASMLLVVRAFIYAADKILKRK